MGLYMGEIIMPLTQTLHLESSTKANRYIMQLKFKL